VAASVEPSLLVIDEVLAVGDIRFQEKCATRLAEFKEEGATIVLASHYDRQVETMCSRAIWIARGRILADGEPHEVQAAYREAMRVETERRLAALPGESGGRDETPELQTRFGTGEVEIIGLTVSPTHLDVGATEGGPPVQIDLVLEPRVVVDDPIIAVSLHRLSDGFKVLDVSTRGDGAALGRLDRRATIRLSLDHLDVEPGAYYFDVGVYERDWSYVYDYQWQAQRLNVGVSSGGGFGPARRWYYG
jgi:ABC-type glutathione transport system ATPase component